MILVNPHISLGNAVASVTTVVSSVSASDHNLIHFPINGTLVLSFTPQHTHGSLQLSHLLLFHWKLDPWVLHFCSSVNHAAGVGVLGEQDQLAASHLTFNQPATVSVVFSVFPTVPYPAAVCANTLLPNNPKIPSKTARLPILYVCNFCSLLIIYDLPK
jgi:hypothetical protein